MSLECRAESLAVTLTTDQPFTGRLFSQAGGSQCGTRGTGRRETALVVGLDQGSVQRCGVERREGVVSTVIVVQHHPVIQRRGDKAVQVLCYFQATNKVVTNSYDIIAKYLMKTSLASPHGLYYSSVDGGPAQPPPSVLNGTAETPAVRLRITTARGEDVTGTRLGEKLFLRIEMDSDSIFGMFARNLRALRGDSQENQESIQLLDERGCPTEPVIFSGLRKVEGDSKSLEGSFEAFKFSETSVVRFQVSVQFCVGECRPAQCEDGATSLGRRRREVEELEEPEELEELEVLELQTELVKEIFVESPATASSSKSGLSLEDPRERVGPVYVRGEVAETELVCTSWPVVLAVSAGIIFLQLCLLSTCLLCLYTSHSNHSDHSDHKLKLPSGTVRPGSRNSLQTLYSLRTTFRD